MATGWSIQLLGDTIEHFVVNPHVQVEVDRKFIITSVGKHPDALAALRRIKAIAKDRLYKDDVFRPKSAAALEKQYGFVVLNLIPLGAHQDHVGIHTPIGIVLIDQV